MTLKEEAARMLPAIEAELQRQVARLDAPRTREFHRMLTYHMGWTGQASSQRAGGKRIRPLLLLLACASVRGRWREAVPAAAAIEIAHNFSLVHDDIQDNSPTRRGQAALWAKFGTPLAINAGDALFTLAEHAILDLQAAYPPRIVLHAAGLLQAACLDLTRGQFLDLHHPQGGRAFVKSYWPMIEGKTAALLSAATQIGAILGGASGSSAERYRLFGHQLGMAFQVQDDILGIWGNEAVTGKSAASDLAEGKLSLPVAYGLDRGGRFARRWRAAKDRAKDASTLRALLGTEGAYDFAVQHSRQLTEHALLSLRSLHGRKPASGGASATQAVAALAALEELSMQLLSRRS